MCSMSYDQIISISKEKYSKKDDKPVKYGTAGFRTKAEGLEFIMFRMGLLAVLRSKLKKGASIGVMITASHNPVCDNGVKLVDPMGEMLAQEWEANATALANAADEDLGRVLTGIQEQYHIDVGVQGAIVVGRDTRPSSGSLQAAVEEGAELMGARVRDLGVVSTPILHYVVTCSNDGGVYGDPSEEGYFSKISSAFVSLSQVQSASPGKGHGNYVPEVIFDGANGVGAIEMAKMGPHLKGTLKVDIYNSGHGELNHMCGADYVKTNQRSPTGVPLSPGARVVSVDGDADRVVYSYVDGQDKFHLLDGDKIATLVGGHVKKLMEEAGLSLKMGVVQTAYANGASTAYLSSGVGVGVSCAKTGVKFLHEAALAFDVGVYFEANGHGTVVFSDKAKKAIRDKVKESSHPAAVELSHLMAVTNETVGDAISDMLLVEAVLRSNGWSAHDWDKAYTDLPNKLTKITVADRSVITTTNAERTCVAPPGLQAALDALVVKCPQGRAFVRPSGTEDVVRVYAEAATKEGVDALAYQVSSLVYEMAGGRGEKPMAPTK